MSLFYDAEEEKLLQTNLKKICTLHRKIELDTIEPTKEERKFIRNIIDKFIKKRNRIVYGGFAYDLYIKKQSKGEDYIYDDDLDYPDIEFYTTEFHQDIRDLCDELASKVDKPIMAEEGVHSSTFKVKVNFEVYCDITFYPQKFYDSIPTQSINGFLLADPSFLLVDVYKIYNYPFSNFFRLVKTFTRANKLLKYYPFEPKVKGHISTNSINNNYLPKVFDILKNITSLIFIDIEAYNFYMRSANLDSLILPCPYYVVISTNYTEDVNRIYSELLSLGKIELSEYYPFIDCFNKHVEFYINDEDKKRFLVHIYDESESCIPYNVNNDIKVSTIQSTMFYLMISRQKLIMDSINSKKRLQDKINVKDAIIKNLIRAKKEYFKTHNKAEMFEEGPFQEFVVQCEGQNISALRVSSLRRENRKASNTPFAYRYIPGEQSNLDRLILDDFIGSEIKKESNLTINNLKD